MQIPHDPDRWMAEVESHTCPFHRRNPGASFAGCTCSGAISTRERTPDEYRAARLRRLRRERDEYRAIADGIEREIERLDETRAATRDEES